MIINNKFVAFRYALLTLLSGIKPDPSKRRALILILSLSLFLSPISSFAASIYKLTTLSSPGKKFNAEVLIDSQGAAVLDLEIGTAMDYKLLNETPPSFLNSLYVMNISNLYKKGKLVAFVLSKEPIRRLRFPLILKIFSDGKPALQKFYIDFSKDMSLLEKNDSDIEKEQHHIIFKLVPVYRYSARELNVAGRPVTLKSSSVFVQGGIQIMERANIFFDLGSSIVKLEDSVDFNSLTLPTVLKRYDGGRGFFYGGGISGTILRTQNLRLDMGGGINLYNSKAETTTSKIVINKTELALLTYNINTTLTYRKSSVVMPFIGIIYSQADGDIKIDQKTNQLSSNEKTDIDPDKSVGIILGIDISPIERFTFHGEVTILSELTIAGSFVYEF